MNVPLDSARESSTGCPIGLRSKWARCRLGPRDKGHHRFLDCSRGHPLPARQSRAWCHRPTYRRQVASLATGRKGRSHRNAERIDWNRCRCCRRRRRCNWINWQRGIVRIGCCATLSARGRRACSWCPACRRFDTAGRRCSAGSETGGVSSAGFVVAQAVDVRRNPRQGQATSIVPKFRLYVALF